MIKYSVLRILVQGYRFGDGIIKDRGWLGFIKEKKIMSRKAPNSKSYAKQRNVWKYKTAQNLLKALKGHVYLTLREYK